MLGYRCCARPSWMGFPAQHKIVSMLHYLLFLVSSQRIERVPIIHKYFLLVSWIWLYFAVVQPSKHPASCLFIRRHFHKHRLYPATRLGTLQPFHITSPFHIKRHQHIKWLTQQAMRIVRYYHRPVDIRNSS